MKKLIAAIAAALCAAQPALAYEWVGKKHGCVTESADYIDQKNKTTGKWVDSPGTFFIHVRTCSQFAAEKGLTPGTKHGYGAGVELLLDQARLDLCSEQIEVLDNGVILQAERLLGEGRIADFSAKAMVGLENEKPFVEEWRGLVLRLHKSGEVDFSEPSFLSGGGPAWFILHATCSPLE